QAEDGIRDFHVTGVQTCALPIFGIRHRDLLRNTRHQISTLNGKILWWILKFGQGSSHLNFYAFRSAVSNHDVVLATDVLYDVRIKVVTTYTDGLVTYDTR